MDTNLILLLTILIGSFLLIFAISTIGATRSKSSTRQEKHLDQLNNLISSAEQRLSLIQSQIDNRKVNKAIQLTEKEIFVLNIYEETGIKIPSDIIEDLYAKRSRGLTEKQIFSFIENQRFVWKLENSKKPYRKV